MSLVFKDSFNLSAGTTNVEFPQLDLSGRAELHCVLTVSTLDTDAGDTLDVYLQSRTDDGIWNDRVHFTQLLGNLTGTETLEAVLQQFGTLSDDEEESEPSGSASASRLTAGTVKNGPFPRPMRRGTVTGVAGTQMPGACWRASYVMVDADADGSFVGTLRVYAK